MIWKNGALIQEATELMNMFGAIVRKSARANDPF
jgi:hypothetical protein